MENVQNVGRVFFPLDRELGILPKKRYTPQIQASMTRLGAKLPFAEAAQEVGHAHKVKVSERTVRETTHENGAAAVAIQEEEKAKLQEEAPKPEKQPEAVQLSADGCFICTTTGEWREVKTMAIGEIDAQWDGKKGAVVTRTKEWSYYSSCATIRKFEEGALPELHRRGVENAKTVVAVNDGSSWIQSLTDYHCPDAVRILDFSHAAEHVAAAGKAVMGENTDAFRRWYADAAFRLKEKPPQQTIARLYLLQRQTDDFAVRAKIGDQIDYLQRRFDQIDYPHFQARYFPIGSGSVESSHKHVVQKRMKQAGMRWSLDNIDSMLALRNLVANGRWTSGWHDINRFRLQQLHNCTNQPSNNIVTPPATLDSVDVLPESSEASSPKAKLPYKPAPDDPWRRPFLPQRA